MPSVSDFINALERRGALQPPDLARLRQLQEAAPQEFVPRVMLRWLVNRGRINANQAQEILAAPEHASADSILDRILGPSDELELEPTSQDVHEPEDDTKDLFPASEESEPLTLPAPGTPPFLGSEDIPKPVPKETKPSLKNSETSRETTTRRESSAKPLQAPNSAAGAYSDIVDQLFSDGNDETAPQAAFAPAKGSRGKKGRKRGWDSPLMLVGGGALLVLLFGGAFLLWRIARQSGDEAFAAAEGAYSSGSYPQAVELYDRFLEKYPKHISADRAIVHRGLARLRMAVEGTGDWPRAFRTAAEVLEEIAPHEAFGSAHADLSVLLPDIAQKLAKSALETNDETTFTQAKEAQQLIAKYLPSSDVLEQRTAQIQTLLTLIERRHERGNRAGAAAATITEAIKKKDFAAAYRERAALVKADPEVASAPELRAALTALAEASAGAVQFVAVPVEPLTAERPNLIQGSVALTDRSGRSVEAIHGRVGFATAGGVVFALDAESGRILWRRPVGFDSMVGPLRLSESSDADTLIHDSRFGELVVLETSTGKLRRRIPLPTAEANDGNRVWVKLLGDRLLVTCESGRVYSFDTASGKSAGYVSFPQPLAECVVSDPHNRLYYQFAKTGVLYVLSAKDLSCLQSVDVGHDDDTLTAAPLCVGPHLLMFERVGAAGRMRVWETDKQGLNPREIGARSFPGSILSPPQVSQRFVAVVDLTGKLAVFDLSQREGAETLRSLAEYQCGGGSRLRRHLTFQGNQLWVGGAQCERLELQPALGKLSQARSFLPGILSQAPPILLGEHVLHVWRQPNHNGCYAGVFSADDGRELWQTLLAAPLASPPLYDAAGKRIVCVRENGPSAGLYELKVADLISSSEASLSPQRLDGVWSLEGPPTLLTTPQGARVIAMLQEKSGGGEPQLLIIDKSDTASQHRSIKLTDPPATAAVAFQGGVVVATKLGQIQFWNVVDGAEAAEPFQPPLTAGTEVAWSRPEVSGDSLLVSDRLSRIYRLTLELNPSRRLVAAAEAPLTRPLEGGTAVVGKTLYAADSTHMLLSFQLPDLRPSASWDCGDRLAWNGPVNSGNFVFAATAVDHGLNCRAFDGEGRLLWTQTLRRGAWPPLAIGGKLYVVDMYGGVSRLDPADGKELSRSETGLAFAQPPIAIDENILLTTAAGELVWITQP